MIAPEWMGLDWIWWMGRVEDTKDPKELGRVKVRIYGFHGQDYQQLPTNKLPWAQPLMPVTSASQGGVGHTHGLQVGSWVMGFFADGRRGQFPIVMGTFHAVHATAYSQSSGAGASSGLGPSGSTNAQTPGVPSTGGTGTNSSPFASSPSTYSGDTAQAGVDPYHLAGTAMSSTPSYAGQLSGQLTTFTTASGATFTVDSAAAPQFQAFTSALEAEGYTINTGDSYGYNDRSGMHGYGAAIDINSQENPTAAWGNAATNLPSNTSQLAATYGLSWGNGFSTSDPMHFEISSTTGIMTPEQLAAANQQAGQMLGIPLNTDVSPYSSTVVGDSYAGTTMNANPDQTGTPYVAGTTGAYGVDSNPMPGTNPSGAAVYADSSGYGVNSTDYNSNLALYNPMNEYTGETVSWPPDGKSPDNATETSKSDLNVAQDTTRGDAPYATGDNSAVGEKLSSDVGTYPNVMVWHDSQLNGLVLDSTPGANRVKLKGPSSSYAEIDHQGNQTVRTAGDLLHVARGNASIAADTNIAVSAGKGSARIFAGGNIDAKNMGTCSLDSSGGLHLNAEGSSVLKWSGDLVISARSIKLISQAGIDIRGADEINMEAGSNMNLQSGATMALESKGGMNQVSHADWNAKADGKSILGSGGDMSLKSGGALKAGAAGDANMKGANVKLQGGVIDCDGTTRSTLFSSPAVPQTPPPAGGGDGPDGAADPDDPATALTAATNTNTQVGRAAGSGGGGVAASARATSTIDGAPADGASSTQNAQSVIPQPVAQGSDGTIGIDATAPY